MIITMQKLEEIATGTQPTSDQLAQIIEIAKAALAWREARRTNVDRDNQISRIEYGHATDRLDAVICERSYHQR